MEEVLKVIDRALADKGLSDAAASRLAVGNPSLLKNLRNRRGAERDHPFENLARLAKVLDLELYFGPPRPLSRPPSLRLIGVSEPSVSDLGPQDARRFGYRTLPWHPFTPRTASVPIAFSVEFLNQLGADVERIFGVEPSRPLGADDQDERLLTLVEYPAARSGGPAWWCYREAGRDRLARLQFLPDRILILGDTPRDPIQSVALDDSRLTLLGRAVWVSIQRPDGRAALP